MKINATKFYTAVFVAVLFCQLYLPSFKVNIYLQIFAVFLFLFLEYGKLIVSTFFLKQLAVLVGIMGLGFIGTMVFRHSMVNILKDIFHFMKPVVGLLIGYLYFRKINNFRVFVKTIVVSGIISAAIHFFVIAFYVKNLGAIESIREFSKDNFLELFALFFLIYYKKFEGTPIIENRKYAKAASVLLFFSCFLYFSRTMIVVAIILLLSIYGFTRITRKTIQILGIVLLVLGLLFAYLYTADIKRSNKGFEAFLYKIKNAPAEIFETRINTENHAELWDHWRGYEAKRAIALIKEKPGSLIFGTGHGSLVNLKFYAPLTDDNKGLRYISELHNGYVYILYKTGIIGLFMYLLIMARWYIFIYARKNFMTILISAIGLIYFISTITITGVYNARDIIIFILGALLYFVNAKVPVPGR
ncbi:hypothetical protein HYN59_04655 [Flavobacterium album]|uniref:O-antigen ligase-related domain-containing protein n=1 Tax=Flavobacterium album TaxID=2175091 RepID=A0A2S1QVK1_9FLAO|nr:O-antigen ligase family protein [Flavobacterium album]AWH84450.1 hypothetical protein HYN59_04655 [Flavobacterium album]